MDSAGENPNSQFVVGIDFVDFMFVCLLVSCCACVCVCVCLCCCVVLCVWVFYICLVSAALISELTNK